VVDDKDIGDAARYFARKFGFVICLTYCIANLLHLELFKTESNG
jgi:hypothetical protein